jgi:hypothetical protein
MKKYLLSFLILLLIVSCEEKNTVSNGKAKPDNNENRKIGYIQSIIDEGGKQFIKIDFIDWFSGEEGGKAMKEDDPKIDLDEMGGVPPDDYYVRNEKIEYFKLPVINDIKIKIETYKSNQDGDLETKTISLQEFKSLFSSDQKQRYLKTPFWVEIKNGVSQSIEEQFIP